MKTYRFLASFRATLGGIPAMRKPTIPELLSGVAAVALWLAVILLSVKAV
jgi:hypothetical protein